MFSGIVETTAPILDFESRSEGVYTLTVERPGTFDDVAVGDSISINGVCLTVEQISTPQISFAVGPETLKVTNWAVDLQKGSILNIERSLRLGDRIHGHLVSGHVEDLAIVVRVAPSTEWLVLELEFPRGLRPYFWKKGSVALNGVSLTINEIQDNKLSVCLIPETLARTNLAQVKVGDRLCIEPDFYARGLYNFKEVAGEHNP